MFRIPKKERVEMMREHEKEAGEWPESGSAYRVLCALARSLAHPVTFWLRWAGSLLYCAGR